MQSHSGVVRLRGYGSRPADLRLHRYPLLAWVARVTVFGAGWLAATVAMLVLTFDPFIASFPFVIGMGLVYRAVRGRYRVEWFRGHCPGCEGELSMKAGSKIAIPHHLVCFNCHHEPELLLGR